MKVEAVGPMAVETFEDADFPQLTLTCVISARNCSGSAAPTIPFAVIELRRLAPRNLLLFAPARVESQTGKGRSRPIARV